MKCKVSKKILAAVLAAAMTLSMAACGKTDTGASGDTKPASTEKNSEAAGDNAGEASAMDALIEAAKAEGSLTVYGSCEEAYLSAACQKFEELYGIRLPETFHR